MPTDTRKLCDRPMSKIPNACYTCGKWNLQPDSVHTCHENPVIKDLKAQLDAAMKQVALAKGLMLDIFWYEGGEQSSLEDVYIAERVRTFMAATAESAEAYLKERDRKVRGECWGNALKSIEFTRIAAGKWEPGILSQEVWVEGGEPMIGARESILRAAILTRSQEEE